MAEIYINEWPPFSPEAEAKAENVRIAARLMINAALTAPSTGGTPQIEAHLVYGRKEMEQLAKKMEELARVNPKNRFWKNMFKYEAVAIREHTDAVVFLGNYAAADDPWDVGCGACYGVTRDCWVYSQRVVRSGFIDMTESTPTTLIDGPLCQLRVGNLGYSVAAALWVATRLLVDSRPMMSVGVAGQKLGYCPNSKIVVGLPVAAYSKNPYVDFMPDYHLLSEWHAIRAMRRFYSVSRQVMWYDYRHWDPLSEEEETKTEEE